MMPAARYRRVCWVAAAGVGYLLPIYAVGAVAGNGTWPPGFQMTDLLPPLLILLPAWHLGRYARMPVFFFLLGCVPAFSLFPDYLCDLGWGRIEQWSDAQVVWEWTLYIIGLGLVCRKTALATWNHTQRNTPRGFDVVPLMPVE
jgi:hypothetical protein